MMALPRPLVLALVVATLTVGCGMPSGGPAGDPGDPGPGDEEGPRRLLLLGDAFRTVAEGAEHVVEVRYVRENGAVIPRGLVQFTVEGDLAGGSLSANAAETDEDGLATVVVRAGRPTRLIVTADAEGVADPVSAIIDVIVPSFGDLQVTVSYEGERPVRTALVGLYTNMTCSQVAERDPSPTGEWGSRPGATVTFEDIEIGVPHAVLARGFNNDGYLAADGCLDITLAEPRTVAEVVMTDVPEAFGGTYDVVERFDVTAGMSDGLDGLLAAMSGLTSDPAQFIVGFVASSDSTPDWLRAAIGNPVMAALVTSTLREAIEGVEVPSFLSETADLGADLDRALSGLELRGELVLGEPDEFGSAAGTHRITTMVVPVDEGTESRSVRAQSEMTVAIGDELGLPEHALSLEFGSLVETILEDILLPRLPGSPDSILDLARDLFDCSAIASYLVGDDSLAADLANAVCDVGVTMVADEVQGMVRDLFDYSDLTLSGTATLEDRDGDYDRDTLTGGTLQARWTGGDGELAFPGTVTGSLHGDTSGR